MFLIGVESSCCCIMIGDEAESVITLVVGEVIVPVEEVGRVRAGDDEASTVTETKVVVVPVVFVMTSSVLGGEVLTVALFVEGAGEV